MTSFVDLHQVRYPQLPDPDTPDLGVCLDVLAAEVKQLRRACPDEIVVVCHSLACALWLHAATDPDRHGLPVDRVLLVAPPSPRFTADHPEISGFTPPLLTAAQLAGAAPGGTRLVAADDDPYCPEGAATAHPVLRDDVDILLGAGHLDLDAGYGPWPAGRPGLVPGPGRPIDQDSRPPRPGGISNRRWRTQEQRMNVGAVAAFALVAALVTITPGVDTMLVLSAASRHGAARGLLTAAGTISGLYCWGLVAATGTSAVVTASTGAYTALRTAGAVYLFWLGFKALRSLLRTPAQPGLPREPVDPPDGVGPCGHRASARLRPRLAHQPAQPQDRRLLPQHLPPVHPR